MAMLSVVKKEDLQYMPELDRMIREPECRAMVSVQREPSGHNLMYPTKWCTPNSGGNQSVRYAEKCDFRQA